VLIKIKWECFCDQVKYVKYLCNFSKHLLCYTTFRKIGAILNGA
jgi:hypothetical protein